MGTSTKSRKESTQASATEEQGAQSEKGPIWDNASHRVRAAMWKHTQEGGTVRYTTAINRSYKDDNGKWQSVHFFDESDLQDVMINAKLALDQIDRLKGLSA